MSGTRKTGLNFEIQMFAIRRAWFIWQTVAAKLWTRPIRKNAWPLIPKKKQGAGSFMIQVTAPHAVDVWHPQVTQIGEALTCATVEAPAMLPLQTATSKLFKLENGTGLEHLGSIQKKEAVPGRAVIESFRVWIANPYAHFDQVGRAHRDNKSFMNFIFHLTWIADRECRASKQPPTSSLSLFVSNYDV